MEENERPNYYAIIPADVRYDTRLRANEKLLYGEITCLANKLGYCFASNNYFADLYNVTPQAVSKWISHLEKYGYITCEYIHNGKEIKERQICLVSTQIDRVSTNDLGGINKRLKGYKQKVKDNNTSNNNTRVNNYNSEQVAIINHYSENHKKLYEQGKIQTEKIIINYGKVGSLIKNLLKIVSVVEICTILDRACNDDFCLKTGYSLAVILSDTVAMKLLGGKNYQQKKNNFDLGEKDFLGGFER